jgi:hypothetical protein
MWERVSRELFKGTIARSVWMRSLGILLPITQNLDSAAISRGFSSGTDWRVRINLYSS